jgi:tetratricopeptide (TPR) repeat protein
MYYLTNGNFTDAKPLLEQALQSNLENLGADHPATLSVLHNLGGLYYSQRIFSEALPRFKETLQGRIARLGDDHHDTMLTRLYVGMTLGDLNRFQEAIPYLEQAFHASRQNPLMQRAALPLIVATWSERDRNRAAQVADELLTRFPDHADAKNPNFAGVLLETGQDQLNKDSALAERLLRSALASLETLAPRAWQTAAAKSMLGRALQLQQKLDEAEPLLVASQADLKSGKFIILPRERSNLVATTRWLAELYEATDRLDQAAQLRKELPTESPGEP